MMRMRPSIEYLIAGLIWLLLAKLTTGGWSVIFAICAVLALTTALVLQLRDDWRR